MNKNIQTATFGGGCFWCTEAIFKEVKGVETVVSGYAGGKTKDKPTYSEICSGVTGYAEVILITFDANVVLYQTILIIFMTTHNPTTLNKQGADVGTQYRSVIFYHDKNQEKMAKAVLRQVRFYYSHKIVTEISALPVFYEAEKEHQDFYKKNKNYGYCSYVIEPKLAQLRKIHADKL